MVEDMGDSGKGPKTFKWWRRLKISLLRKFLIAFKADIDESHSHVSVRHTRDSDQSDVVNLTSLVQ